MIRVIPKRTKSKIDFPSAQVIFWQHRWLLTARKRDRLNIFGFHTFWGSKVISKYLNNGTRKHHQNHCCYWCVMFPIALYFKNGHYEWLCRMNTNNIWNGLVVFTFRELSIHEFDIPPILTRRIHLIYEFSLANVKS